MHTCTVRRALAPLLASIAWLATPTAHADPLAVTISYLGRAEPPVEPLSLVEPLLKDEGIQGARQGIIDDQTTGRFLKHDYKLVEHVVPQDGDVGGAFAQAIDAGERLFVVDLKADELMGLAPAAEKAGAILLDSRTNDDDLRTDKCSKAVFHTAPSYAMKTDALAEYMAVRRWGRWLLIRGSLAPDVAYANALKRSAKKFGLKVVDEREYKYVEGSRRTDTGVIQIQGQIPVFTQGAPDYDVAVVADESDVFGEYIPYHTWDPRPVVGTVGLVPTAWSRVHEQWGGTQLQRRFEKLAGRWMTERDYNAWVATRAVSEAVTRTQTTDPQKLRDYMLSDKFELGAFKGQGVSFRRWDQQLREPMLLVTPRMLVSVSPQDQFLHRRTPLDTLGFDEPESKCRLNG
jgi:ABC transporter substrate binding protein (PQQ-dependent alcohol dehydrogenase system)